MTDNIGLTQATDMGYPTTYTRENLFYFLAFQKVGRFSHHHPTYNDTGTTLSLKQKEKNLPADIWLNIDHACTIAPAPALQNSY